MLAQNIIEIHTISILLSFLVLFYTSTIFLYIFFFWFLVPFFALCVFVSHIAFLTVLRCVLTACVLVFVHIPFVDYRLSSISIVHSLSPFSLFVAVFFSRCAVWRQATATHTTFCLFRFRFGSVKCLWQFWSLFSSSHDTNPTDCHTQIFSHTVCTWNLNALWIFFNSI